MVAWARVLLKPKLLGRFMKTKAGRRAAFKFGGMLLKSRATQKVIESFMGKNASSLEKNKEYKDLEKNYKQIQQRVAELEAEAKSNEEDKENLQALAFTLGRQVVEMQKLYNQMQQELQRIQQQQTVMLGAQKTR